MQWQGILTAYSNITKGSKLIAFQFQIIHHILPAKSSPFQAGITETDIKFLFLMHHWKANNRPPTVPLNRIQGFLGEIHQLVVPQIQ